MFLFRAWSALSLLAGFCMVVSLCGCGDSGEIVEFSSEPTAKDLELGDLIGQGDGDGMATGTGQAEGRAGGAAAGEAGAESRVVHFFSPGFARPFSMVRMRLFQAFLNQAGGPPVRFHDGRDDAELQKKELLEAIDAGASAIVVSPVELVSLRAAVARGVDAGIPVVVLGAGRDELPGSINLPVDYYRIGQMAAEFVIQRLEIKARMEGAEEVAGEIVELTGSEDLDSSLEQMIHAGFSSVIGRYPGVMIVHQAPGLWHTLGGAERIVEATRIQPGANVVFCHNDAMAYGVYLALRDQDRAADFLVVGVDGISGPDGGITRVRDQMLGATVSVPLLARQAAQSVMALIEGQAAPRFEPVSPELVTIANSAEMYDRHMKLPFGNAEPVQAPEGEAR